MSAVSLPSLVTSPLPQRRNFKESMDQFTGGCLRGNVRMAASRPNRVGICHCLTAANTMGAFPLRPYSIRCLVDGETREYAAALHSGSPVFALRRRSGERRSLDGPDQLAPYETGSFVASRPPPFPLENHDRDRVATVASRVTARRLNAPLPHVRGSARSGLNFALASASADPG